jgi:hypothetical protein
LKQTNQVQTLASLVADLYSVIPPTNVSSDEQNQLPVDKSYTNEMRELLNKIEEQLEGKSPVASFCSRTKTTHSSGDK